jgi:hypothetical protein
MAVILKPVGVLVAGLLRQRRFWRSSVRTLRPYPASLPCRLSIAPPCFSFSIFQRIAASGVLRRQFKKMSLSEAKSLSASESERRVFGFLQRLRKLSTAGAHQLQKKLFT